MNLRRAAIAMVLLVAAAVTPRAFQTGASGPPAALETLPYSIGAWRGTDAPPALDPETEKTLAADAVLNRTYLADDEEVGLYIAYYREQRPGVSVHSPLHCLPGTGWEPEDTRTISIDSAQTSSRFKRLLVRKNLNRAVVLYGYSVGGRLIADEVLSKLWLLNSRIQRGRGDAALVRVVVPVYDTVAAAEQRGLAFTRQVLPYVVRLWS